ncbi:MAG: tRNA (adenosine(37)-N6)-threonylcarbamoyltransferase complex ATPase subunit type 1 TsaE [Candidatus Omnitrophica bacterium]|nr:tRNA (adenosine(37)-N6)-threonylcarbamoyltransferase complex ATPase subunit type 1 TsaE [Candidatus Omnitrophota bacterium]
MTEKPNLFPKFTTTTSAPPETIGLGERLGKRLLPGSVLMLSGDLGTGKTTFIKGLARGLGFEADLSEVLSPSYVLVREVPCSVILYHVDLYRLNRVAGEDAAGIMDCMQSGGVTAVEWGEKAREIFPKAFLSVKISYNGELGRDICFEGVGGFQWLGSKKL